jgi:transmembrane sensor
MDKALLHKYFRGETSKEEERLIMDWADSSEANHAEYLEERKMWNALLVHFHENANIRFNTFVLSGTFRRIASIAAIIALLFTVSWIYLSNNRHNDAKLATVIVPPGQRVQLILEDGTRVWLNSNSVFVYPTTFNDKLRTVQLNGEAYFEVTHDAEKPFIVKTSKYNIKVLGTTFNVYAYKSATEEFETSLLEGSVDVSTRSDVRRQHIILNSNEKVSDVNGYLHKQAIGSYDRFKWKDGLICLDDVPFGDLMKKFAIYYNIRIDIYNSKVFAYRCTGKFRQSDGIEYALRVIQKDLKFKFTRDDERNIITIK